MGDAVFGQRHLQAVQSGRGGGQAIQEVVHGFPVAAGRQLAVGLGLADFHLFHPQRLQPVDVTEEPHDLGQGQIWGLKLQLFGLEGHILC